jgi:hypothetical protein
MPAFPIIVPAAVLGVMAVLLLGCGTSETATPAEPTSTEPTSGPSTTSATPMLRRSRRAVGVRRFFVEDPGGSIVNVLAHLA